MRLSKADALAFQAALNSVQSLAKVRMQTDPVRVELEVAFACIGRARRLLLARDEPDNAGQLELGDVES